MSRPTIHRAAAILCLLALSGCGGWQSVLDPQSAQARHLADLFWFFLIVCAVVWGLVVLALMVVLRRRRAAVDDARDDTPARQRRKTVIVSALVALTAIILVIFTFASFYATRDFAWADTGALKIKVTGQQWWWQVEYQDHNPSLIFATANEIHIPTGRHVTFDLEANDVIHSFWVPNLMGKQDLIPGRKNYLTLEADHPGVYRGQCAEFCGLEHAHMAILVFAQTPRDFEKWRNLQLQSARPPSSAEQRRGLEVFLGSPCASCHTIQGVGAGGQFGPDLTHFGSRTTLAAASIPNTPAALASWIADPQALKPGANMPQVSLSVADRAAIVAYLEGLK
jgi:cytochrome c oxidase subunit 2